MPDGCIEHILSLFFFYLILPGGASARQNWAPWPTPMGSRGRARGVIRDNSSSPSAARSTDASAHSRTQPLPQQQLLQQRPPQQQPRQQQRQRRVSFVWTVLTWLSDASLFVSQSNERVTVEIWYCLSFKWLAFMFYFCPTITLIRPLFNNIRALYRFKLGNSGLEVLGSTNFCTITKVKKCWAPDEIFCPFNELSEGIIPYVSVMQKMTFFLVKINFVTTKKTLYVYLRALIILRYICGDTHTQL